jgi:hypothetical protein
MLPCRAREEHGGSDNSRVARFVARAKRRRRAVLPAERRRTGVGELRVETVELSAQVVHERGVLLELLERVGASVVCLDHEGLPDLAAVHGGANGRVAGVIEQRGRGVG